MLSVTSTKLFLFILYQVFIKNTPISLYYINFLLGINYFNNEDEFFYEDNDEYPNHYKIVRVNPTIENVEGDTYTHRICNTTQSFRIKSHLMQSLTNNTIYCVIVKDKKEYPAAKLDLVFGPVGTSGTNNTLIIELEKEVETNSGLIEIKPPA